MLLIILPMLHNLALGRGSRQVGEVAARVEGQRADGRGGLRLLEEGADHLGLLVYLSLPFICIIIIIIIIVLVLLVIVAVVVVVVAVVVAVVVLTRELYSGGLGPLCA